MDYTATNLDVIAGLLRDLVGGLVDVVRALEEGVASNVQHAVHVGSNSETLLQTRQQQRQRRQHHQRQEQQQQKDRVGAGLTLSEILGAPTD